MTQPLLDLRVRGAVDAARARAAVARVLDAACAGDEAELEFLDDASSWALRAAGPGGPAALAVDLSEDGLVLRATVRDGAGESRWQSDLPLREPLEAGAAAGGGPGGADAELLAEELLRTSERAGRVAAVAAERARELAWHQRELEETNQGVLALHAELAEASDEQRRLLAAERSARDQAEAARNRLTFLSTASARLMTSLNQAEIFARLRDLLVPERADSVEVWLTDEDGGLCDSQEREAAVPETVLLAAARRHPTDALAEEGELALPLITGSGLLGVLLLRRADPLDADDEVVLVELSRRAAASLDNARRFERERDTAATLQRAMLTELPETPGMEMTARYLPATRGMNVGGDWYDVFSRGDGEFIGVVGDVTGHGIHAAVMMGQLRTALRAYALEERSPAVLLERLHGLLCHLEPDLFATAVIVRFRPGDPEVVMAGGRAPAAAVARRRGPGGGGPPVGRRHARPAGGADLHRPHRRTASGRRAAAVQRRPDRAARGVHRRRDRAPGGGLRGAAVLAGRPGQGGRRPAGRHGQVPGLRRRRVPAGLPRRRTGRVAAARVSARRGCRAPPRRPALRHAVPSGGRAPPRVRRPTGTPVRPR